MGVNKLTSLMKTMAGKAGFERRLNDNNVPTTHIMQLSGHRNLGSVNNYSTLSKEQQKNMSLILSDNSAPSNKAHTAKTSQTVATAESSSLNNSVIPASGAFSGTFFHSRVIARNLEREPKKMEGGGGKEETLARKPHDSGKRPLIFHGSVHL